MKLSDVEFRAMNTFWRKWGQQNFEVPMFRRMGLDIRDRDVLEIGCGSGFGGSLLSGMKPKSYIGIDVMPEQIEIARHNFPALDFRVQDAADLSMFADRSKDVVIIFGVLHHIPEWRKTVDEVARLLRPGGNFFVEEPDGELVDRFDAVFRWGHPQNDFRLRLFEDHSRQRGLNLLRKQWTPLLTMYAFQS